MQDNDPASVRAAEKVRRALRREHAARHDRRMPRALDAITAALILGSVRP